MYLSRPYQTLTTYKARIARCTVFGALVFLFLWVFRPFGMEQLGELLLPVSLGYGGVCTAVMLLLNVATLPLMPRFFAEENWTVGRELSWTAVNIFFIALANVWFSVEMGFAAWSWQAVQIFGFYTLCLGIFPAAMVIVINEARLKSRFAQESQSISSELGNRPEPPAAVSEKPVMISSENQGESFSVLPSQLLFVRAADNYSEVYFVQGGKVMRSVVRNSLKNLESEIGRPELLRCHKSYLVNTMRVVHVSGNAQGYKLHLSGVEELIPVSRQMNESVKSLLTGRP